MFDWNNAQIKWNMPSSCPVCGGKLSLSENHKHLKCENPACRSKAAGNIMKWTNTLGIKEFGPATIDAIIELGYTKICDLYKPELYAKLERMPGFGKNSVEKMAKEVGNHRKMTLAQFIAGYNFDSIGEKQVQKIIDSKNYESINDFRTTKSSDFVCDGIGEKTAEKIVEGMTAFYENDMRETQKFIEIIRTQKQEVSSNSLLGGKSFCFTGAASIPRKQLQAMVTENGGIVHDSVKKDTTYLVMADPTSTSTKAEKARKNGTLLLSEAAFFEMVGK